MEEIKKIIEGHEARSVSVTGQVWYEEIPVCVAIVQNARRRGFFFVGDVVRAINERCKILGFPGEFTSKSNPVAVAILRGTIESRLADNQTTRLLDIESTLEYLRQYKPRRREERSE